MTRSKKRKRKVKSTKEIIQYKIFKIHKLSYQIVHSKDEIFKKRNRAVVKRLLKEIKTLKDSTQTTDQSLTGTI